jgi:hypothetical protein
VKKIRDNFERIDNYLVYRNASPEIALELLALNSSHFDHVLDEVSRYIKACNAEDKLTRWTISINVGGEGSPIDSEEMGFPNQIIKSSVRRISGSQNTRAEEISLLKNEQTWVAGGRSANIHSGADLKVSLENPDDIDDAIAEFLEEKRREIEEGDPEATEVEINKKLKTTKIPEWVYRRKMPNTQGVIVVYLIDSNQIFIDKDNKPIEELNSSKLVLGTTLPLIGLAVGIPKINDDPMAMYMESKDHITQEELIQESDELSADMDALSAEIDAMIPNND